MPDFDLDAAIAFYTGQEKLHSLDLFSTSPTKEEMCLPLCSYRAPFFAYPIKERAYGVLQGCCNHWDCPRCGIMRAKHEYGRIVEGCRTLAKEHELFFITITCRGKELSREEADNRYLEWTNRLLDALRAESKRRSGYWAYVQVTERQKRAHPHSHILTTYRPSDMVQGSKRTYTRDNDGLLHWKAIPCLRSGYLQARITAAGLGEQYDISKVDTVEGASRYVAKYMFKETQFKADFPKNWKRVRYSQNFPKLPVRETNAFALVTKDDWGKLASLALVVQANDEASLSEISYYLRGTGMLVRKPQADHEPKFNQW